MLVHIDKSNTLLIQKLDNIPGLNNTYSTYNTVIYQKSGEQGLAMLSYDMREHFMATKHYRRINCMSLINPIKVITVLTAFFCSAGGTQALTNANNSNTIYERSTDALLYQNISSHDKMENNFLLPFYSRNIEDQKANAYDSGYKLTDTSTGLTFYLDIKDKISEIQDADALGIGIGLVNDRSKMTAKAPTGYLLNNKLNQMMVYGNYEKDIILSVLFSGGKERTKTTRIIDNTPTIAFADFKGHEYLSQVILGYHFQEKEWVARPIATLQHQRTREDAYTETGANAQNLQVDRSKTSTLQGILGVSVYNNAWFLVPEVHVNYYYKFHRPTQEAAAQFVNGGAFVPGPSIDNPRVTQNIGAGIILPINAAKRIYANASYDFYKQTILKRQILSANIMWMF